MPPYNGPRGTGFTSLKQYLELNPESAQRMGNELVSDVDAKGAAAEGGISGAFAQFGRDVDGKILRYDPNVGTSAEAAARAGTTYAGPRELDPEVVKKLSGQATEAQNSARALGTDSGRAVLLADKYAKNGGYTPGAAGLDAFLAGRGAGERGHTAGAKWGKLSAFLDTTTKAAQHMGADAAATTATNAARYGTLAGTLKEQESAAAAAAQNAARNARIAGTQARRAEIADARGNTTTVNRDGTYAGADNMVSGGPKGRKNDEDDFNKFRRFP